MKLIWSGTIVLVFLFLLSCLVFIKEAVSDVLEDYEIAGDVVFDGNIRLMMQDKVENAHEVSLVVNLPRYLHDMKEFVLLVDNNPIQQVMRIEPHRRIEKVGTNIRMERTSPVRVAVLDSSNVWRVVTKKVFVATPGGCSAPSGGEALNMNDIGRVLVNLYERRVGAMRIKTKVLHPMDTGLVLDNDGNVIPEYYIDRMEFSDDSGLIAIIETFAALSANPMVMLDLPDRSQNVRINMSDSKGYIFRGECRKRWNNGGHCGNERKYRE